MVFMVEKERNGKGETRITRYYRCPVCGTKVVFERLVIRPVNGKFVVLSLLNGREEVIPGARRSLKPKKLRAPRKQARK